MINERGEKLWDYEILLLSTGTMEEIVNRAYIINRVSLYKEV